ncbi:hypothetical protein BST85_02010 [Aureitalea marina]|uniref:Curlin associated repeat-containing protein n=2 Tax=Aureitalea marina TaxID=930804 RepID=A0A2S7KMJ3_9FLAO|nr:hypothetical protein BST85_02010 [Aureitalea marina]
MTVLSVLFMVDFSQAQTIGLDQSNKTALTPVRQQTTNSQAVQRTTKQVYTTRKVNTTVQQVGNYNQVNVDVKAYSGQVGLHQFGNKNNIAVNLSSLVLRENVLQQGNNHNFVHTNMRATRYQSATVIQRGSNQNLIMQGQNRMSKNMIVNMRGRNQTVIIRNFR